MSEPTTCVACIHDEPPLPGVYGGRHICLCEPDVRSFVTGNMLKRRTLCEMKNTSGNCRDFEAKQCPDHEPPPCAECGVLLPNFPRHVARPSHNDVLCDNCYTRRQTDTAGGTCKDT